ncbi:MAG TPA: hypothetical protein VN969_20785 [Streptosporangiaceae bacterium]|nr:hypothetical protein [Streptosporangiaceae bacterium]
MSLTRFRRKSLILLAATATGAFALAGCAASSNSSSSSGATAGAQSNPSSTVSGASLANLSTASACVDGKVKFGIAYIADGAVAAAEASGRTISAQGAAQAAAAIQQQFSIGLNYLNSHGGWLGCQVVPVYFQFHIVSSDYNTEDQQMCLDFSSAKVFAAINWITNDTPLLPQCLSSHGIPIIWDSDQLQLDNAMYKEYAGYLYQPWGFSYDRWGGFVQALRNVGVLPSGTKVGIVVANNGAGAETYLASNILTPKFTALGDSVQTFTYTNISGLADLSGVATQMSAAVLKFKSAGIQDVMFTPSASVSSLEFSTAANSQDYFPTYIMNSLETPGAYLTTQDKTKALFLSFLPAKDDVPPEPSSVLASVPSNPAYQLCADTIYKGVAEPPTDFCDAMFFIKDALSHGKTISVAALSAGVAALGTSFDSANGYGPTDFSAGVNDGGQEVGVEKWDPAISAFNYVGSIQKIP